MFHKLVFLLSYNQSKSLLNKSENVIKEFESFSMIQCGSIQTVSLEVGMSSSPSYLHFSWSMAMNLMSDEE